jgi:hypothetical protein
MCGEGKSHTERVQVRGQTLEMGSHGYTSRELHVEVTERALPYKD